MTPIRLALLTALAALAAPLAATDGGIDLDDTRLLADPAISARHVAFAYAGDLWIVDRGDLDSAELASTGGRARRLTSHAGEESRPRFSPDGETIAFSAEYDGNVDVYTISVDGGEPRRLTWHPADDLVQEFLPAGDAVLFVSDRAVHTRRFEQLFTVPVAGGFPSALAIPYAAAAAISPDGATVAYNPLAPRFRQWKNYRGGTASRIWLFDRESHGVVEVPRPPERSNDFTPMWLDGPGGATLYFLSDRAGEFNLFSYRRDAETGADEVAQLTFHDDFPILHASARAGAGPSAGGAIVYEQAGWLHVFDPATGESERLRIGAGADLRSTRPRWASGARWIRDADLSPSGARAVFEYRGEIVTVPAEKGDPRNLTATPGAHERSPAWSPDGRSIAYFSDASGEYRLVVAPAGGTLNGGVNGGAANGGGGARDYPLDGAGFYQDPKFSPDGAKISYTDNSRTLYWLDLATGERHRVSSEPVYGPIDTQHHAWSPDARWLAYTRITEVHFQQLFLHDLESGVSHPITDGLADVGEPVFDASGRYLWFSASTDAGPVRSWFAMSNADTEMTNALYLAVLRPGARSPLAKESDEEEGGSQSAKGGKGAQGENGNGGNGDGEDGDSDSGGKDEPWRLEAGDLEDLAARIVALPLEPALYRGLASGPGGRLYYLRSARADAFGGAGGGRSLRFFDLKSREETTLLEGADAFTLSADGEKVLVMAGEKWLLAPAGKKIDRKKSALDIDAVTVRVEPRAEWRQIFDEAWRINRDYFYDPGMHGADWPAMRERYAELLPHLADRDDLNRVIRWMSSELAVGHHRVVGGDFGEQPEEIPGGLLGADYEIADGRYRFARVFGGLNWNPELRAPLREPGVDVEAGEYLLAVDGVELVPPENLYRRFENKAGKLVALRVGPDPDGAGARTVMAVPIENERALRNRAWVEDNLRKVHEATGGRVAYVYVPNTAGLGHTYFKRYFFPQAGKDAIIVDERYNGGGQVADYYIDILRRPHIAWWATRYGKDIHTPLASIQGPKVMLIDETAGSGGDLLPWMFRKLELGPLIGKRTWGGLVGILGFPVLMDGGRVTAPNLAIWTPEDENGEGGFVVENQGVPPDIEVEQWPAEVIAGRDPQLEKAIEVVLEMLERDPPERPERPPYPIRARQDRK